MYRRQNQRATNKTSPGRKAEIYADMTMYARDPGGLVPTCYNKPPTTIITLLMLGNF